MPFFCCYSSPSKARSLFIFCRRFVAKKDLLVNERLINIDVLDETFVGMCVYLFPQK